MKPMLKLDMEGDNENIGTFVLLQKVFDFVDFDYISHLFNEDGLIDFISEIQKKKLRMDCVTELSVLSIFLVKRFYSL